MVFNELSNGTIPTQIGDLTSLKNLSLGFNSLLNGTIQT
jgi:hypothetical protein